MKAALPFVGAWCIGEMDEWDRDAVELLGPAHFTFERGGIGEFRFVAVVAETDCRFGERGGQPLVEFSWDGQDDGDTTSGRGWAVIDKGKLVGRIFIHLGDESGFTATRGRPNVRPRSKRPKVRG